MLLQPEADVSTCPQPRAVVCCVLVTPFRLPEENGTAAHRCWSRAHLPREPPGQALTRSLTYPDVRAEALVPVLELIGLFGEAFQPLTSGRLSLGRDSQRWLLHWASVAAELSFQATFDGL